MASFNDQKMSNQMDKNLIMSTQEAEASAQSKTSFQYVSGQFPTLNGPDRKENLVKAFKEMFHGSIDEETLLDVLEEKLYDFNDSFDALIELTSATWRCEAAPELTSPQHAANLGMWQDYSPPQDITVDAWAKATDRRVYSPRSTNSTSGPRNAETAPVNSQFLPQTWHPSAARTGNGPVTEPSESQAVIASIIHSLRKKQKTLVMMRGLPGSGKSFLANELSSLARVSTKICSADTFFERGGEYVFLKELLFKAHQRCQTTALRAAANNCMLIIIDNTNTRIWEMSPYVALAITYGYHLAILEPSTYWKFDPKQLVSINVHGVPLDTIETMLFRYEKVTVEQLILKLGFDIRKIQYITGDSPQEDPIKQKKRKPRRKKGTKSNDVSPIDSTPCESPAPEEEIQSSEAPICNNMSTTVNNPQGDPIKRKKWKPRRKKGTKSNDVSPIDSTPCESPAPEEEIQSSEALICNNMSTTVNNPQGDPIKQKKWKPRRKKGTKSNDVSPIDSTPCESPAPEEEIQSSEAPICNNMSATVNNPQEEPIKQKKRKPRRKKGTKSNDVSPIDSTPCESPAPEEESQISQAPQNAVNNPQQYVGFDEFCASMLLTQQSQHGNGLLANGWLPESLVQSKYGELQWNNSEQVPTKEDKEVSLISFDEEVIEIEAAEARQQHAESPSQELSTWDIADPRITKCQAASDTATTVPTKQDLAMTDDSNENVKLQSLFPQLRDSYLDSILAECHGNIDWAIDMLLESPMLLEDAVNEQNAAEIVVESTASTSVKEKAVEHNIQTPSAELGRIKLEKRAISKQAMEVKRKLEQLVVLNQASPRRSNRRRSDEASCSKTATTWMPKESSELATATAECVAHASDEEEEEEDQFVEMMLKKDFAENLLHMFGGPPLTKMEDFKPTDLIVNVPVSVAQCLHFFWLETLQQNFDKREEEFRQLLNNDEKLAIELSQQNDSSFKEEVPDLKEIMDMEMTLACFKNEQKMSKTDLATTLTRQLLTDQFPKIDPQALDSVFAAHGHNYKKTLDAIIASFGGNSSVCTVMSPEAIAQCKKQLLEKARDESLKLASEKKKPPLVVEVPLSQLSSKDERKHALQEAQRYRDEASEHRKHRVQCFNKAENALRQGMPEVARYYSDMGQLYKQRMEQANGSAAACLFGVANADTLDLHYLYVAEALEVLDVFLDYHAERMSKGCQARKTVELVTGRGRRSEGGKPRIKPAVIRRLKQRGLRFQELNPGSLCVFLSPQMMSSCK